jgi:anti-sigma factor RsiW
MNCEEATKLMDGYLDGELDPITSQTIEQHLRDCRNCEQTYETHGSLIRAIGNATPYFKAPAELRERIQSSLREEIAERPLRNVAQDARSLILRGRRGPQTVPSGIPWNWQFLATQLIASHVRSLMANHLTDVASSDQHTVKPWLDAKLDFAPAVVDLSSEGFPLIGGRLDYLDNRPVAALIYQRRKHFINLFVWPAAPDATRTPKTITRQGYQLLHWTDSDFNYWAVSDVNEKDLETFKQQFEAQTSHH